MRPVRDINIVVGARVKTARELAGLTQAEFAELVKTSTKNVSVIERGVSGVSISTVKSICEALSISSDSLILGIPDMTSENDTSIVCERLKHLSSNQFGLTIRMLSVLFDSFSIDE